MTDRDAPPRPGRRLGRKFALVALLAVLLLEGAIRVRQWIRYGTTTDYYQLVEHPESGLLIPEPGLEVGPIRVNSLGFRGPEIERPKPRQRVRLAFLGGSTTFCAEASSDEDTWPHLVVADLRELYSDLEFDYVNAGCAGYSTAQSRLNFEHRVAPLEPDVVVIYHGTNDLTQESRVVAAAQGRYDLDQRESSTLSTYWLTWALVEKNLRYFSRQRRVRTETDPFEPDLDAMAAPFRERLTQLVDECRAVAPVVLLPTFRHRSRRDQDPEQLLAACSSSLYYMPFMNPQALLDSFDRFNEVIEQVAASTGAILVGGEDAIPGDTEHFRDSVHFTDRGGRMMADQVREALVVAPAFLALVEQRREEAAPRR